MNPTREEALFAAALEQAPAERAAFLKGACLGDDALRKRVEGLLASHDATANPLHTAAGTAPTIKLDLADAPDEAVGQTLGRYKLLERVGEGGCGVVYVAEQTEPVRRRVALKVIKLGMDTKQVVARFEAERQALAMMDHPNIAKVLDAGTTEKGRPFFVMELVRGIPITAYCDQAHLRTQERLELFIKVCQAIQHAHQKGIIHRDIKPSNILVTLHDGVPVPKVIDFGIAKATEGRLTDNTVYTQLHQFIGTPAYMSPEQAEMSGLDIDTRSDIYSLGVLLYELLAGSTPFDAKELMASGIDQMRKTIREKEPQRPSTRLATLGADQLTTTAKRRSADTSKLLHQLKGDLDWIVMKCLEKDRQRRYDTANGLAADIKRHLDNEPVVARPPTAGYRLQKTWKRHRLACTAGILIAALLTFGITYSAIQTRRANQARNQALVASEMEKRQRKIAEAAVKTEVELRSKAETAELASRRWAYAAAVNLAQKALASDDLGRARTLLNSQGMAPGKQDLRGWEWRFLWSQCRSDAEATLVHGLQPVSALALSPDGRYLAHADLASSISLIHLATHEVVLRTKGPGYFGSIARWRMAFSPTEPLFAFHEVQTNGIPQVRIWDTSTGTTRAEFPAPEMVTGLVFSPDGQHLAISDATSGLHLCKITDGRPIGSWPQLNTAHNLVPSPDGKRLFVPGLDDRLVMIDGLPAETAPIPLPVPTQFLGALAVSPDGKRMATAGGILETSITLWDPVSLQPTRPLEGHRAYIHHLAFSPDSRYLASAGADQTLRLWDPISGKCLATLRGHSGEVWAVAFTPDSRFLYSASKDGSIRRWSLQSKVDSRPYRRLSQNEVGIGFTSDSRGVLTENRVTGTIRRWNLVPNLQSTLLFHVGTNTTARDLSRDRTRMLTGHADGHVREWDLGTGRRLQELRPGPHPIDRLAYMADPDSWAIESTHSLRIWNRRTNGLIAELQLKSPDHGRWPGHPDWIPHPHSNHILWAPARGLSVWDPGSHPLPIQWDVPDAFDTISLSQDGLRILGTKCSPLGMATAWSLPDLKPLGEFRQHLLGCHSGALSSDGRRVLTGSSGNEAVRIWDFDTQMDLITLDAHLSEVSRVEFSPDGNHLMASSRGGTAIWSAPSWSDIKATDAPTPSTPP